MSGCAAPRRGCCRRTATSCRRWSTVLRTCARRTPGQDKYLGRDGKCGGRRELAGAHEWSKKFTPALWRVPTISSTAASSICAGSSKQPRRGELAGGVGWGALECARCRCWGRRTSCSRSPGPRPSGRSVRRGGTPCGGRLSNGLQDGGAAGLRSAPFALDDSTTPDALDFGPGERQCR